MENKAIHKTKADNLIETAVKSCDLSALQFRITSLAATVELISLQAYETDAGEHDRLCYALDVISRELNICAAMAQIVDNINDVDKVIPTV